MKKICLLAVAFSSLFFVRCSTDVDLIAPYKETTIVYGLLDPADSVQYIRVAKAFLGEGNSLTMAKQGDSVYYADADIQVVLQRWKNSILVDTAVLIRDESIQKEPGIFSNQPNVLYRLVPDPVNHTDSIYRDSEYRISIRNKISGNVTTSKTAVIGTISVTIPSPNPAVTISLTAENPSDIKWYSAINGKIYNVIIRCNYKEYPLSNPNAVTLKSADWIFPNIESKDPRISEQLTMSYLGDDFFKNLGNKMQPDPGVFREFTGLDFVFTIGAEEFYTYYLVNQPSLTINQNLPQFTNVTNGLGIFSSRTISTLRNKLLDANSLDSLRNGRFTANLGFI